MVKSGIIHAMKKNIAIAVLFTYFCIILVFYIKYDKRAFVASDEIVQLKASGRCN